jgi:GNAT superfamily N-acetyltransferase
MTVREAEPGDRHEVRELLTAAYRQYAAAVPETALFERYFRDVTDVDHIGKATRLVVESDGRIAGTALLYAAGQVDDLPFFPPDWAWVRAVGVHPELRGAGMARQLMAECLDRARAGGAAVLSLHTMAFMVDAIRLYERLGYRRAAELDIDVAAAYEIDGEMLALAYRLDIAS